MTPRARTSLKRLLPALVVLLMAGCNKYLRLAELGSQFCSYKENFHLITTDGAPELTLLDPVMFDSDMEAFLGVMPTYPQVSDGKKETVYLFRNVSADSNRLFRLRLDYTRDEDDDWRLSGITGDRHVARIVPLSLIEQSLRSICSRDTSYSLQQIEFDLTLLDEELIPQQQAIHKILGPPETIEAYENGEGYHAHYEMHLISAKNGKGRLSVDLFFDGAGQMTRSLLKVHNTALEADFEANRAVLKLL